jgi:hypothetical protein
MLNHLGLTLRRREVGGEESSQLPGSVGDATHTDTARRSTSSSRAPRGPVPTKGTIGAPDAPAVPAADSSLAAHTEDRGGSVVDPGLRRSPLALPSAPSTPASARSVQSAHRQAAENLVRVQVLQRIEDFKNLQDERLKVIKEQSAREELRLQATLFKDELRKLERDHELDTRAYPSLLAELESARREVDRQDGRLPTDSFTEDDLARDWDAATAREQAAEDALAPVKVSIDSYDSKRLRLEEVVKAAEKKLAALALSEPTVQRRRETVERQLASIKDEVECLTDLPPRAHPGRRVFVDVVSGRSAPQDSNIAEQEDPMSKGKGKERADS